MNKKITVLGATGFTGQLICKALDDQLIDYSISGRDKTKLEELNFNKKIIIADIEKEEDLKQLMKQTDILINAVGPFNIYGNKVITKAAQSGIIYLDITGEQEFVKFAMEEINPIAIKNSSLALCSCAFDASSTPCCEAPRLKADQ